MIKSQLFYYVNSSYKYNTIVLIACIYIFLSCHSDEQRNKIDNVKQKKTIITDQKNSYSIRCNILGIDNLKINKEFLQIRIWAEFSFSDSGKIVILKRSGNDWAGQLYQFRLDIDNHNKNILRSKSTITGNPSSGWDNFLDHIKMMGVYDLNDSGRKNNWGLCNDGGTLIVEIVKDNEYFEYIYPCWTSIEDQTQISKIKNILREVEREFNFKIFPLDYESDSILSKNRMIKSQKFNLDEILPCCSENAQ
jgi:hypothetical protein